MHIDSERYFIGDTLSMCLQGEGAGTPTFYLVLLQAGQTPDKSLSEKGNWISMDIIGDARKKSEKINLFNE